MAGRCCRADAIVVLGCRGPAALKRRVQKHSLFEIHLAPNGSDWNGLATLPGVESLTATPGPEAVVLKAKLRAETAEAQVADDKRQLTGYAYADRIYLAQRAWDDGQAQLARDLLGEAGGLQEELTPGRQVAFSHRHRDTVGESHGAEALRGEGYCG